MATRMIKDPIGAEDVVQQAFFMVLKWNGRIVSEDHCGVLLTKIVKQRIYNKWASDSIHEGKKDELLFGSYIEQLQAPSYPDRIDTWPLAGAIIRRIPELPPNQSKIAALIVRGLSAPEIAGVLGKNSGDICKSAKRIYELLKNPSPRQAILNQRREHANQMLEIVHKENRERIKEVLTLHNMGISPATIAEKLNADGEYVRNIINKWKRENDPDNSVRELFDKRRNKILGLTQLGLKIQEIADVLGETYIQVTSVHKWVRRTGGRPVVDTDSDPWFKNTAERVIKERVPKVQTNNAKLSEAQVITIKTLILKGKKNKEIEQQTGVKNALIKRIKYGYSWSHIVVASN